MLSKCRLPSIPTVHFKRQLLSPPTVHFPTKTTTNDSKRSDHRSPPPSRLRAPRESIQTVSLSEAKQLHGHFTKLGLRRNICLQNQIMIVYFKFNQLNDGHKMLDEMPERNIVVWNAAISSIFAGETHSGHGMSLGFSYFRAMLVDSARPDRITLNVLLRFCAASDSAEIGTQLHCFAAKIGFGSDRFVAAGLIDLYAKFGLVKLSKRAFDEVLLRDSILWNVMVHCYASNGSAKEATRLFNLMRTEGFSGDEFTLANLLKSLRNSTPFELVKQAHGLAIRRCFDADILVSSALVDTYSKDENLHDARKVFDAMRARNVVTWNAMIVGYGQHGEAKKAIELFVEMLREEHFPDGLTLASVVSSCANLGVKNELAQAHTYTIKSGFQSFISTNNALINAYSKCGDIASAIWCFNLASDVTETDLFTWTSIISAFAFHGLAFEAIHCFEKMVNCGIKPDKIAFLGVLSACSHAGLIEKGLEYFKLMTKEYKIPPDHELYTCLVDLIARSGLLNEALAILNSIPFGEGALGAFLGACRVYGNSGLAELAAVSLMALQPNAAVNYKAMSNVYSSQHRWSDVARLRAIMRRNCGRESLGFSWVEIGFAVHKFVSGDWSHPRSEEVFEVLELVFREIKEEVLVLENSQSLMEQHA